MSPQPGPTNSLVDVPGVRVGHHTRRGAGWLTGVTVVLPPAAGAVGGVDVRGGAPGTRETDLLDPRNAVDRVHAVVLSGGSAFGLAAADGVMRALHADGVGWPVGRPGEPQTVVPIVPAAVLFDLGRGGDVTHRPTADDGVSAYAAATGQLGPAGVVGAGTGARAGGLKGGVGSASVVLPGGTTVAALVVVNAVGSTLDLDTGELYAARFGLGEEFAGVGRASPAELSAHRSRLAAMLPVQAGTATTLCVIATDATLGKARCQKLAGVAHDGLARAIVPAHTVLDGDTVFALATGDRQEPDLAGLVELMEAAAGCLTRAIGHAVVGAESVDASADGGEAMLGWRDAFPSAHRS